MAAGAARRAYTAEPLAKEPTGVYRHSDGRRCSGLAATPLAGALGLREPEPGAESRNTTPIN